MTKRILISFIIGFLSLSLNVNAIGYSFNAIVENQGSKKYKSIKLVPEIYNNINGNFADLTILDKDNETVSYFVRSFSTNTTESKKSYEMQLNNSYLKDDAYYFDYAVKNSDPSDVTGNSIEVKTNSNGFAKRLELFGSYDNVNWDKVQDDILYNVDGNQKLYITFSNIRKYTFYRIKMANNLEKITFSSVLLNFNDVIQNKQYFIESYIPEFKVEEKDRETHIKLSKMKNLKLDSITLQTDSMFKRNVSFEGAKSKMLYNLTFENTSYTDTTIPLDFYKVETDSAEILINNNDDKPIKVLGVKVKYLADELIFDGSKQGDYNLKFGNKNDNQPKVYDLSNYKNQIINDGYDALKIKEIKIEPGEKAENTQKDYKLIFNIIIGLVAVIMGIIIFLKLKK